MKRFRVVIQNAVGQRREVYVMATGQGSALRKAIAQANADQVSTVADPLWRPIAID